MGHYDNVMRQAENKFDQSWALAVSFNFYMKAILLKFYLVNLTWGQIIIMGLPQK